MPVTASTLWADKQMFTFDQAQSMRVLALSGQGVVVDIFSIHNRSDRTLVRSRKESPAHAGLFFLRDAICVVPRTISFSCTATCKQTISSPMVQSIALL